MQFTRTFLDTGGFAPRLDKFSIGLQLLAGLGLGASFFAPYALLILPLYVPVLIFGAGAVDTLRAGLSASAQLSLLAAGLLSALVGAPLAAAAAVRIALD